MVKIMENPIKMDDLGGNPPIFWNIHMVWKHCFFLMTGVFEHEQGIG